jgi:glycosyltransferase involved in cell wall biosynthesis
MEPRILFVVSDERSFWTHRAGLARDLRDRGYEVAVVAAQEPGYPPPRGSSGVRIIPVRLKRGSMNPAHELGTVAALMRIYRQEKPDLIYHANTKPLLYGSLAARAVGVPAVVNVVTGLGLAFRLRGVPLAYRLALSGPCITTVFQNPDDMSLFLSRRMVRAGASFLIRGAGVDTSRFVPTPEPEGISTVLFASRLIWSKGVGELVAAARRLRGKGARFRLVLAGAPDAESADRVPTDELHRWIADGTVEWLGLRDDMERVMAQSTIVTLPSYFPEGVPKALLEAGASARPMVTTDTPGCREVVQHGVNGMLVQPRNESALAEALEVLLADGSLRRTMGAAAREIAVQDFDERLINGKVIQLFERILRKKSGLSGME